jgi:hypothetical protein
MYTLTEKAIQLLRGRSFRTPIDLLDAIYPEVLAYGQTITSNPDLRKTFVLNALVGDRQCRMVIVRARERIHHF